jgi:imidazole glycerol-phosphate synthase subunit HisF
MERKMFYKASPLIFDNARSLRKNMTAAETILWGFLRTKPGGYKFRRQHPLGIYIADFFCYPLKLVIEVDGKIHTQEDIRIRDVERQKLIEADGIRVIRFKNEEVMNHIDTVISTINAHIIEQKSRT